MLVLRRKINQSIIIGDNIRVVVVGVDGDHVKIGVDAPGTVSVQRSEIVEGSEQAGRSRPPRQNEKD